MKSKVSKEEKHDQEDVLTEGTIRVVTQEDIEKDSRLVAASAVVGQLYDFSNLASIPEEAAEENAHALNQAKDLNDSNRVAAEENPAVNLGRR